MQRWPRPYLMVKMAVTGESDGRISRWRGGLAVRRVNTAAVFIGIVGLVRFTLGLALEFFFFFALFGKLFLAFFVGIIGSGH